MNEERSNISMAERGQFSMSLDAGAGLGGRGLTWTGPRSSFLGQMAKPFFRDFLKKWLFEIKMDKMVTNGGLRMHLQNAPKLSKEWEGRSRQIMESVSK